MIKKLRSVSDKIKKSLKKRIELVEIYIKKKCNSIGLSAFALFEIELQSGSFCISLIRIWKYRVLSFWALWKDHIYTLFVFNRIITNTRYVRDRVWEKRVGHFWLKWLTFTAVKTMLYSIVFSYGWGTAYYYLNGIMVPHNFLLFEYTTVNQFITVFACCISLFTIIDYVFTLMVPFRLMKSTTLPVYWEGGLSKDND